LSLFVFFGECFLTRVAAVALDSLGAKLTKLLAAEIAVAARHYEP
jgi:hypothetical protein